MSHEEMHRLGIAHGHGKTVDIAVEQDILSENNRIAGQNRNIWNTTGCWAINLVSSPGSGKTTLLESTIKRLGGRDFHKIAVIEGDQHTDNDAGRIRNLGIPAIQINTHNGCHLDARMVSSAFDELAVKDTLLFIENVGNLVCPAMFDLGENLRVVLLSVTEGDDKPLKYPYMFAGADICIINKIDLLPYVDSDVARLKDNALKINPQLWNKTCRYDTGRIEKVLSVLQLKQGDTVLDIGTGTGVMIPFIREQVGHYAPIVAVDSSEKMLREASLRFPNAGVSFVRADVERDRLGGRFNAILLYSVFPHFRYPVDTIARLVTDNLYCGGRLLIAHSQSREQLNEMHKRISDKVFARNLLPVAEQVAQFTEIGLSVASFDETDEYYYILLQRVGRKLGASVADAIY